MIFHVVPLCRDCDDISERVDDGSAFVGMHVPSAPMDSVCELCKLGVCFRVYRLDMDPEVPEPRIIHRMAGTA